MEELLEQNFWLLMVLMVWTIPWKGWALWKAAKLNDKWWFVALLLIQTVAILDILYIFIFSKRHSSPILKI
ncbi:MAG: Membrane protein [Parcubacteria group bacterium GW2011_GWA2_47_21]|nr:MAG: Membrane protein [Parcubacteria group bacterium GW2011_GWA2_47_21]